MNAAHDSFGLLWYRSGRRFCNLKFRRRYALGGDGETAVERFNKSANAWQLLLWNLVNADKYANAHTTMCDKSD